MPSTAPDDADTRAMLREQLRALGGISMEEFLNNPRAGLTSTSASFAGHGSQSLSQPELRNIGKAQSGIGGLGMSRSASDGGPNVHKRKRDGEGHRPNLDSSSRLQQQSTGEGNRGKRKKKKKKGKGGEGGDA
jgi:hypothetical protein